MEKLLLKLVTIFNPVFRRQGININQLYSIVRIKLIMDKRRVYLNLRQQSTPQKEKADRLWPVLLAYGFMSIFFAAMIAGVDNIIFSLSLFHAYLIIIMAMALITDFSTVLLDTADNVVILPRPVDSRTLLMSRIIHIVIYLLKFYIALTIIPLIATFWHFGWLTGITVLCTSLLSVLLALSFTYLLYLLFLNFSNEQKLKEVITYVQIVMAIVFMVGYQVMPRVLDFTESMGQTAFRWYHFLLPPMWMAYTAQAVFQLYFNVVHIGMLLLAVALPFLLFYFVNRYLAPSFSEKLAASAVDGIQQHTSGKPVTSGKGFLKRISYLFGRSPAERGSFELMWRITGREKYFRLQFYPSLAYMLVMAFVFLFKKDTDIAHLTEKLAATKIYLWFVYLPLVSAATALSLLNFSENFSASWIYHSTPLQWPGELITGAVKGLLVKYFLPIYILFIGVSYWIWGTSILDDFLLGFCNIIMIIGVILLLSKHQLPFSIQANTRQRSGRFIIFIINVLLVSLLVLLHYLMVNWWWLVLSFAVLTGFLSYLVFRDLRRLKWSEIVL